MLRTVKSWNVATMTEKPFAGGLHGGVLRQSLRVYLEPLLGSAVIGDCRIPFCCVAGRVKKPIQWHRIIQKDFTDHVTASIEKHVFGPDTPIIDALMASSAIPVLFSPMKIERNEYIDLVHFGAIPSRSLIDLYHPEVVIGTQTVPSFDHMMWMLPAGWKEFYARGKEEQQRSKDACDVLIIPDVSGLKSYEFGKGDTFAARGRAAAKKQMETIKKMIEPR
jgi:predicted acylesterase/phospholipase RssA